MPRIRKNPSRKTAAIEGMRTFVKKQIAPLARFDQEAFIENLRLQRVAARLRDRVAKKAFQSLGIDVDRLEEMHRKEDATAIRRANARAKKIKAYAVERARRSNKQVDLAIRSWPEPPDPGAEITTVLMPTADKIDVAGVGPVISGGKPIIAWANLHLVRGAPGRNAVSGWGNVNAGRTEGGALGLLMDFHFVWASTRSGRVYASALVKSDLTYRLGTEHNCRLERRSARIYMNASLSIGQYDPNRQFTAIPLSPPASILDREVSESGISDPTTGPVVGVPMINELVTGGALPFPILSGYPVVTTVSIYLLMSAVAGFVNVDFNDPLRINVPMAWLDFE